MLKLLLPILLMMSSLARAEDFVPNSFSVEYTKKIISKFTKKQIIEKGTLAYLYPSYYRAESQNKTKTIYVINHETFWYFQEAFTPKEKSEVQTGKAIALPIMKALDSLKKGLDVSPHFIKKPIGFNVTLTAKPDFSEESNIKEIQFKARKNSIKTLKDVISFTIVDIENQVTTYEFDDYKEEKLSKDYFVFKIPENTKVIQK